MIGQVLRNTVEIIEFGNLGQLGKNMGLSFSPHTKIQFQENLGHKGQIIKLIGDCLRDLWRGFLKQGTKHKAKDKKHKTET